ncbi:MAG: hypothetical protein ABIM44_01545 [candidate division WOR-3 bacterium]
MSKNSCPAIEGFRETCRRIIYSSLGESAGKAALLFMQRDLGRDPFDALWEDPRGVYCAMEKIFGRGVKVLVHILVAGINRERGLNISPERFLELMCNGNQSSVEEIRSIVKGTRNIR